MIVENNIEHAVVIGICVAVISATLLTSSVFIANNFAYLTESPIGLQDNNTEALTKLKIADQEMSKFEDNATGSVNESIESLTDPALAENITSSP